MHTKTGKPFTRNVQSRASQAVSFAGNDDWEAGRSSAQRGHGEPSQAWATLPFYLGWLDWAIFSTPMNTEQRRNSAMYRREIVESYRRVS